MIITDRSNNKNWIKEWLPKWIHLSEKYCHGVCARLNLLAYANFLILLTLCRMLFLWAWVSQISSHLLTSDRQGYTPLNKDIRGIHRTMAFLNCVKRLP